MTWLHRLKGATSVDDVVGAMSDAPKDFRGFPLYQNDKRIGQAFQQLQNNVTEMVKGRDISFELSGSALKVVGVTGGSRKATSATIQVTPLTQAMMLEDLERDRGTLVDLSTSPPKPDTLLLFAGTGRVFGPPEPVHPLTEAELRLNANTAAALQSRREHHDERRRWVDPDHPGVLVWAANGTTPLAAFASVKYLDPRLCYPPFKFLGFFEDQVEDAVLLTPMIIWRVFPPADDSPS